MNLDKRTIAACAIGAVVFVLLVATGVTAAITRTEPDLLNRVGSLVVAESLILTVWQFWYERSAEERRDAMAEKLPGRSAIPSIAALARAAVDRPSHRGSSVEAMIWRSRVVIFGSAIGFGLIGEILHGWGDIIISVW